MYFHSPCCSAYQSHVQMGLYIRVKFTWVCANFYIQKTQYLYVENLIKNLFQIRYITKDLDGSALKSIFNAQDSKHIWVSDIFIQTLVSMDLCCYLYSKQVIHKHNIFKIQYKKGFRWVSILNIYSQCTQYTIYMRFNTKLRFRWVCA